MGTVTLRPGGAGRTRGERPPGRRGRRGGCARPGRSGRRGHPLCPAAGAELVADVGGRTHAVLCGAARGHRQRRGSAADPVRSVAGGLLGAHGDRGHRRLRRCARGRRSCADATRREDGPGVVDGGPDGVHGRAVRHGSARTGSGAHGCPRHVQGEPLPGVGVDVGPHPPRPSGPGRPSCACRGNRRGDRSRRGCSLADRPPDVVRRCRRRGVRRLRRRHRRPAGVGVVACTARQVRTGRGGVRCTAGRDHRCGRARRCDQVLAGSEPARGQPADRVRCRRAGAHRRASRWRRGSRHGVHGRARSGPSSERSYLWARHLGDPGRLAPVMSRGEVRP